MRNILRSIAVSLSLLFVGSTAMGAGFALYEYSARGNAMGGAVVANKAEAASIAVNPALITQIEGSEVQVGATFIAPEATAYVGGVGAIAPLAGTRDLEDRIFTLPNFYATYQASENVFLGLAGFSRFGLGGEYSNKATWTGSLSAHKFDVLTFSLTPVIAAKVTDEISLSMGLEFMYIDFSETKYLFNTNSDMKIAGDGTTWGGVFGAYYNPAWAPKWGAGLSYRTKTRHVLNGTMEVVGHGTENVIGSVTLPDSITAGISFAPSERLVLEAGIVGTFWNSYDAIRIERPNPTLVPAGPDSLLVEDKKYKDAYRINFGAEYALTPNWDIRGGYTFDKNPSNDEYMDTLVPVADRHLFNAGVGYKRDNWGVDLSYTYLLGKDMKGEGHLTGVPVSVPLEYTDGTSHMFGITLKYKFGQHFIRSASHRS